jgi:hypothetical protein
MRLPSLLSALLIAAPVLLGQGSPEGWEAHTHAKGWAFQDADGSFLFLDALRRTFVHWDAGAGTLGLRPAPVLQEPRHGEATAEPATDGYAQAQHMLYGAPLTLARKSGAGAQARLPERWVLDPLDGLWCALGTSLLKVDVKGKVLVRQTLPAPVADMVRLQDGFCLCYRTLRPWVEKFDWKGKLLWSYPQARPELADLPDAPLHRIAPAGDGSLLLAELGKLSFTVLGASAPGQMFFTQGGLVAEPLPLARGGRGSMVYCPARNAVLAAFTAAQSRSALPGAKGLTLACFDLAQGTIQWRDTGLPEASCLVAVTEGGAVFTAPEGGLATVPVP